MDNINKKEMPFMKLLIKMLSFIIGHFDLLERNVDNMTKEERESYIKIKSEFSKVSKDKLEEIKKELDSMN